ncbi:MAG: NTP transferase domain-containing protein [Alphaproteobacteria bacterium]|nr:NTP transferase domain-containing protein [Alphaproteobacteria bacterium]
MTANDSATINTAMVLAAGLGTRMQPLTDDRPKPLVVMAGQTLLDRVLGHLSTEGITRIVVNTHYKGEMIADHLANRADVTLSPEPALLETGGGVRNALPHLGDDAFFVVNCDAVWLDGPTPALHRMTQAWRDDDMDALLLLQRTVSIQGETGRGDYFLDSEGYAARRHESAIAPFLFAGVQILHPRLFDDTPDGPFSLNLLYDRAEEAGRLHGLVHDGEWYHVGTPEQRERAEYEITHGNESVNSR